MYESKEAALLLFLYLAHTSQQRWWSSGGSVHGAAKLSPKSVDLLEARDFRKWRGVGKKFSRESRKKKKSHTRRRWCGLGRPLLSLLFYKTARKHFTIVDVSAGLVALTAFQVTRRKVSLHPVARPVNAVPQNSGVHAWSIGQGLPD